MADLSNYLEQALFNHVLRGVALPSPAAVYVALFTAVTDAEAGTGTEVAQGNYARQPVPFAAPTNGGGGNSGDVDFPAGAITATFA